METILLQHDMYGSYGGMYRRMEEKLETCYIGENKWTQKTEEYMGSGVM